MDSARQRPVLNVVGERVALGPQRRDLLPLYHRWDNDFASRRTDDPAEAQPFTLEEVTNQYDEAAKSPARHRIIFTIYEVGPGWTPLGEGLLRDLDFRNRTGVLGISIGEEDYRGRGYGTEATKLLLDYGFTVLGLNNVMLDTVEYNEAGLRAYEKAGFKVIGRWRESALMNGRLWDTIFMDCLASEFTSPVLGKIYTPGRRSE